MFTQPTAVLEEKRRRLPSHIDVVDLPHGIAVGDATQESAVVWTRTDGPAYVHVEFSLDPTFSRSTRLNAVPTDADSDFVAKIRLPDLQANRPYYYRVWALRGRGAAWLFEAPDDGVEEGTFRTPPDPERAERVSFVWSGDTYGQGRMPPYQVPRQMALLGPDFFHYQGDTIYADYETPALPDGNPETVDDYRAKYREMREEATNLRDLLEQTSVVTIWDDHEIANDWSGTTAEELLPAGRQAFFEYWPIDEHPAVTGDDPDRLYRSFRWGKAMELFVLDTRQYRDDNATPDGPDKTMLGEEQTEWLKTSLRATDATFAVVSSSTSLASVSSAPEARDSWASGGSDTGFEHELREIVDVVREVDSTVVWLSGDRHFARVLSYDLDHDGSPDMYEALATPIGAAPRDPSDYVPDDTFSPTVHYEEGGKYELGEFYNFGHVQVEGTRLTIDIIDKVGDRRCRTEIDAADDEDPLTVTVDGGADGPESDVEPPMRAFRRFFGR